MYVHVHTLKGFVQKAAHLHNPNPHGQPIKLLKNREESTS